MARDVRDLPPPGRCVIGEITNQFEGDFRLPGEEAGEGFVRR